MHALLSDCVNWVEHLSICLVMNFKYSYRQIISDM
jgi:hypothetical protein